MADEASEVPTEDSAQPFETVLEELEDVVARLEKGNLPLADALGAFERGMTLADTADKRLSAAEERIEVLVGGPEGVSTRPFQEAYPDVDLAPSDD